LHTAVINHYIFHTWSYKFESPPRRGAAVQRGIRPPHSRGFYITHDDTPQSVGLLWSSDQLQLVAEIAAPQHSHQTSMPPAGFEPTTS